MSAKLSNFTSSLFYASIYVSPPPKKKENLKHIFCILETCACFAWSELFGQMLYQNSLRKKLWTFE